MKIADYIHIQRRFLRSAHLERDFRDPSALEGYVVTPQIQQSLRLRLRHSRPRQRRQRTRPAALAPEVPRPLQSPREPQALSSRPYISLCEAAEKGGKDKHCRYAETGCEAMARAAARAPVSWHPLPTLALPTSPRLASSRAGL
jgi:hypothetical protein